METDMDEAAKVNSAALGGQPPECGLLARTIVESPIVYWALPVQLRSSALCDVAFVGEHFVQISEVRRIGKSGKATQLHHVAKHSGFGSKIRNAGVLGLGSEPGDPNPTLSSTSGNSDGTAGEIPPQILVLFLECGDFVFLFVRADGSIAESRLPPHVLIHVNQGFHFVIDPSSRYMATGTPEGLIIIYQMEPMSELYRQYSASGCIKPVSTFRARSVQGVIHKMDFLFPHPKQPDKVILLLLVVRGGATMMVTYEWQAGENLDVVMAQDEPGCRLPPGHEMPLLVIPLMQRSAFLLVSETSTLIIRDALGGSVDIETVNLGSPPATKYHHGIGPPLWTCWARGYRHKNFQALKDDLYLAREDGIIIHVALQSELFQKTFLGATNCSISTAFTVILDRSFDFIFVGGDSSPGAVLEVEPRNPLYQLAMIPNWTPAIDIVTTDVDTRAVGVRAPGRPKTRHHRVFVATGRGASAAITEYRFGIQADIGLDMDFGEPVKKCWVFKGYFGANNSQRLNPPHYHILLGLPDSSALLSLPQDLSEAVMYGSEDTGFDLSCRTLDAMQRHDGTIIQVTEHATVFITPTTSVYHTHKTVFGLAPVTVDLANCWGDSIAIVHHTEPEVYEICLARVDGLALVQTKRLSSRAAVTCLSTCRISGRQCLVAGQRNVGIPSLTVYELQPDDCVEGATMRLDVGACDGSVDFPTTIAVVQETSDSALLAVGTRSGHVLMLELSGEAQVVTRRHVERLSPMTVDVVPIPGNNRRGPAALACTASELLLLSGVDGTGVPRFRSKQRIIPIDGNNPTVPSPTINSAVCFGDSLTGRPGYMSVLMVSEGRIMLADVSLETQMVPRHLPIVGTPTKLLYSGTLGCLVVAVLREDRPTICFIDPDSGEDLSCPIDGREGHVMDFAQGLGNLEDRVYGLEEWLYVKNGKTFAFIIATTKRGQLLVLSAKVRGRQICYWTRFRCKISAHPIYAVACHSTGLILSAGSTVHWNTLDEVEKKMKLVESYILDSPVTSLGVSNGVVRALTMDHSLVTIENTGSVDDAEFIVQSDEVSRKTMHMVGLDATEEGAPALTLVSDRYCGIRGLRRNSTRKSSCELDVVFEGELGSSVRKFCQGRTRPFWSRLNGDPKLGRIASTASDEDILGVSLDGSLRHFSLLTLDLWRVLNLVQSRAMSDEFARMFEPHQRRRRRYPTPKDAAGSKTSLAIIDGDLLHRICDKRGLESLMNNHESVASFRNLLDKLEDGKLTAPFVGNPSNDNSEYFSLCYDIVGYLLDAVI